MFLVKASKPNIVGTSYVVVTRVVVNILIGSWHYCHHLTLNNYTALRWPPDSGDTLTVPLYPDTYPYNPVTGYYAA